MVSARNTTRQPDTRGTMLMLSHCVPDPCGDAARGRAWQLLRVASTTHRVWLACIADGPVQLEQWRALANITEGLQLRQPATLHRMASAPVARINAELGQACKLSASMAQLIDAWRGGMHFDAVLSTHPMLWRDAQNTKADMRLCDLNRPTSIQHQLAAGASPMHSAWWHRRRSRRHRDLEMRVASTCDALIVGHQNYLRHVATLGRPAVVMADSVDVGFFARQPESHHIDDASPRLAFHLNWSGDNERWISEWFHRHVWPTVREAVPGAELARTDGRTLDALRHASVVVSPEPDPGRARWPVLQAMALERAVIAPQQAVGEMGVRHGEHLLLTQQERDWTEMCVESLRSANVRSQLSRGARAFVERYCPIVSTGRDLIGMLNGQSADNMLRAA